MMILDVLLRVVMLVRVCKCLWMLIRCLVPLVVRI